MSLSDQLWSPTSVQVTVQQARGLRVKGKTGTNDAYAVMQVGKEKYQTSVAEKSVAPVWREEAAFDLPSGLQQAARGGEKTTLHVHVLHRALVGPDKLLGQAVIHLLELCEDRSRSKTQWFKLLDKSGKPDKDRGEVLLDIQFMRNNMTASMFDISAAGKSRSRLGKFKDKVRGKKKDKDSPSDLVPSVTQVLTDSEEEDEEANGDREVATSKDGKNKKHKMKSLFSPKSNLQKSLSQSMSVLPGKSSTLSGSQSSGLNVESSQGKKKFKFKIHKRSGSSDGKDSSAGSQKQIPVEQSNICINGSHIYCEEPPVRSSRIGSNFSLASSGHGSMEEVPENSPPSVDSLGAGRQCSPWTEEEEEEEEAPEGECMKDDVDCSRRDEEERLEDEKRRKSEEKELERLAEENRKREEEEKVKREEEERVRREEEGRERLAEEKRRQEEERRKIEEEKKRQRDEEERVRRDEEKRRQEEEERVRREEEERVQRKEEERRQEEKERVRREEEERRREEEKVRREEKERVQREEEERRQEEKERVRREEEERRREEEKVRREEEERVQREEERRREEKERVRSKEEKRRQEAEESVRREEEERVRREEEERVRREEEERVRREEEERFRREEEEMFKRKEEERVKREERMRQEEEERVRKEEEKRREDERMRIQQEEIEKMKNAERENEEEMRRQEEERARIEEERAQEEMRKRRQDEELELAEKRRLIEEERKKIDEETARKEEEMRVEEERAEEERRQKEELRRQEEEEEERARKEKEENERLLEETKRLEEVKNRLEAEEKIRKEEEERTKMEEERKKKELGRKELEEKERARLEQEKKQREEEEMTRREEEEKRARKEKEESERLAAEKMRREEERRRIEEEDRMRKEEQERLRIEEEERALREKEAMARKKLDEEEKRRIEEEKKKEEEASRLEKLRKEAEEQKKKENKAKDGVRKSKVPSEVTSTNPFDEDYSLNPFEEDSPPGAHSSSVRVTSARQRSQSAVSPVGNKTVSTDEKDLIGAQRERRPAPQPPGRNQAEKPSRKEQEAPPRHLAQVNKQSPDKNVKTISVLPQRFAQMISPRSRSPTDSKSRSSTESATIKPTINTAKPAKRPAPSRPHPVEEALSSETKTVPHSLNPFEEDEDEAELTGNDTTTVSGGSGSVRCPSPISPTADDDAVSSTKVKSCKMARAPPPPSENDTSTTASISQNPEGSSGTELTGETPPDKPANQAAPPVFVSPEHVEESQLPEILPPKVENNVEEGVKKQGPPVASRRLQPVKPLNPVKQQPVSVVQGENDNKSAEILIGGQDITKANDTGKKGPYSQLTHEELVSLVLKQEKQLVERNKKISEMEQYIDNLLVRVIEEQPSILMSLGAVRKPA